VLCSASLPAAGSPSPLAAALLSSPLHLLLPLPPRVYLPLPRPCSSSLLPFRAHATVSRAARRPPRCRHRV
jgi:hypothetical protein